MKEVTGFISLVLIAVVLAASLLPTLHALTHEKSVFENNHLTEKIEKSSVDCELCEFKLAVSDSPVTPASFDLHIPLKEIIYIISIEEKVILSPKSFFSLRAPPAPVS